MPIELVQSSFVSGVDDNPVVTLGATPQDGNLLVAMIGVVSRNVNQAAPTIDSVSGGTAETWSAALDTGLRAQGALNKGIRVATFAVQVRQGSTAVTINVTGQGDRRVAVAEFMRVRTVPPLRDTGNNTNGSNATVQTGGATTNATDDELVCGVIMTDSTVAASSGPTNSYVQVMNTQRAAATEFGMAAYRIFLDTTADPGFTYSFALAAGYAGCRTSFFEVPGPPPRIVRQAVKRAAYF